MAWTQGEKDELRSLWAAGMSAATCADILNKSGRDCYLTRNSIVGMVHRLGIAARETKTIKRRARPVIKQMREPRPRRPSSPREEIKPRGFLVRTSAICGSHLSGEGHRGPNMKAIAAFDDQTQSANPQPFITATGCMWPVGELFCNDQITRGRYCAAHHKRSRSGTPVRERDPRPR